jgi:hypothetical protein
LSFLTLVLKVAFEDHKVFIAGRGRGLGSSLLLFLSLLALVFLDQVVFGCIHD